MPVTPMDPILSKRQLGDINRGLAAVNKALEECELAENCGADCQARRETLEEIRTDLNRFKETYFPDAR